MKRAQSASLRPGGKSRRRGEARHKTQWAYVVAMWSISKVRRLHAPRVTLPVTRRPDPNRRPSNAHGRQRHRRGTDIRNEYARHHSVAESPLARRNLLSDDAAHVRASRYAATARPAPRRERCCCAPRRGGRVMVRAHGWAVLGPWKWKH